MGFVVEYVVRANAGFRPAVNEIYNLMGFYVAQIDKSKMPEVPEERRSMAKWYFFDWFSPST
jgi:hypothetical protein